MKLVFAADIHLNLDEDYSFSVFEEIVSLCESEGIENLFLGGDTFESYQDAAGFIERFNQLISDSTLNNVFLLSGNHDIKGADGAGLSGLPFDRKVRVIASLPFEFVQLDEVEFLFLPFQKDISKLFTSEIPRKNQKRIVIGHGSLIDFNYEGEDEDSFYDDELFSYLEADIVLLGHIHKSLKKGNIYYPGSSRVWRSGEEGKHGVLIVDTENLNPKFHPLESGGEFINLKVEVDDENYKILNLPSEIKRNQWYLISLHGCVTNRVFIENLKERIGKKFQNSFRIEFDESDVVDVSRYYENSLYKVFIEKWKLQYETLSDEEEKEIYRLARKYFLEELSRVVFGSEND
ncbi:MAG: metallophosphoesterase family protein [Brevinematia bacterium]